MIFLINDSVIILLISVLLFSKYIHRHILKYVYKLYEYMRYHTNTNSFACCFMNLYISDPFSLKTIFRFSFYPVPMIMFCIFSDTINWTYLNCLPSLLYARSISILHIIWTHICNIVLWYLWKWKWWGVGWLHATKIP